MAVVFPFGFLLCTDNAFRISDNVSQLTVLCKLTGSGNFSGADAVCHRHIFIAERNDSGRSIFHIHQIAEVDAAVKRADIHIALYNYTGRLTAVAGNLTHVKEMIDPDFVSPVIEVCTEAGFHSAIAFQRAEVDAIAGRNCFLRISPGCSAIKETDKPAALRCVSGDIRLVSAIRKVDVEAGTLLMQINLSEQTAGVRISRNRTGVDTSGKRAVQHPQPYPVIVNRANQTSHRIDRTADLSQIPDIAQGHVNFVVLAGGNLPDHAAQSTTSSGNRCTVDTVFQINDLFGLYQSVHTADRSDQAAARSGRIDTAKRLAIGQCQISVYISGKQTGVGFSGYIGIHVYIAQNGSSVRLIGYMISSAAVIHNALNRAENYACIVPAAGNLNLLIGFSEIQVPDLRRGMAHNIEQADAGSIVFQREVVKRKAVSVNCALQVGNCLGKAFSAHINVVGENQVFQENLPGDFCHQSGFVADDCKGLAVNCYLIDPIGNGSVSRFLLCHDRNRPQSQQNHENREKKCHRLFECFHLVSPLCVFIFYAHRAHQGSSSL